ncbi:MAG: serine/threonine-protein phosphatase [Burkholderia sp.]|jgi:protein phosphatase|nr:serine/threonine-protein phosphatase [Burkholderia sp.]
MAQANSFRWQSASCSHVGRVRRINEDSLLDQPERGLWAVADGMGGHTLGDVASRMVVDALAHLPNTSAADIRASLNDVNRQLMTEAAMRDVQLIGSTAVVLLASGSRCSCIWAGDSRIYRYRDGVLQQLTRDHSHVEELVARGLLSPAEASRHPGHNLITRAIGVADLLELEEADTEVRDGDMFMLCSDGLSNEVDAGQMAELLARHDCRLAAQRLVEEALEHGGRDNVTVVVVMAVDPAHEEMTAINPALGQADVDASP